MLKKCLQYAWKTKNDNIELKVYENIGLSLYYQGYAQDAEYYHTRYSQCELQKENSAIKKISKQMLQEYFKRIYALERQNLNSLFIEYLNLPIKGFHSYPPSEILSPNIYENYALGQSPRKNREDKEFQYQNFPSVFELYQLLMKKDPQFSFEIPDPNFHKNFKTSNKYGRQKRDLSFTQTAEYHKLIGTKSPTLNFEKRGIYKHPLNIRVNKRLS